MNKKLISRIAVSLGILVAGAALADGRHGGYDQSTDWNDSRDRGHDRGVEYARVVDVDPIVRRVRVSQPVQECWSEEQPVYGGGGRTVARSTIVGGLIGAAVGTHIAVRTGTRDPGAVVAGSLIGAAIGNGIGTERAAQRGEYQQVGYQPVQRCQAAYRDRVEERIEGYRVTYVYHGRHYTTRMPYDPGRRVRVNVDVRPDCYD